MLKKVLVLLFVVASLSYILPSVVVRVSAQDFNCGEPYEDLETKCVDTTSDPTYTEYGKYYKCIDTSTTCKASQRCCVAPLQGQYGGVCFSPLASRASLGIDSQSSNENGIFNFLRPQNCDKDLNAIPAGKYSTIVEKVEGAFAKQVRKSIREVDIRKNPDLTITSNPESGIFETVLQTKICNIDENLEINDTNCDPDLSNQQFSWYYGITNSGENAYYYYIDPIFRAKSFSAADPRANLSTTDNLGCNMWNTVKMPFFNAAKGVARYFTNNETLPDIAILCSKGTPIFTKSDGIDFSPSGNIIVKDANSCRCAELSSGPANAAVLLCTRYVTGVGDNSPWREVIPNSFVSLLLGGINATENVQQMRAGVKKDYNDFMSDKSAIKEWVEKIHTQTQSLLFPDSKVIRTRLFEEKFETGVPWAQYVARIKGNDWPFDAEKISESIPKNNYAKEYVSCLSCAKYGGFHSALGCMPMDNVSRFISEGVLSLAVSIGGAFCILCIIYGAIIYQFSMGESARIQKAQKLMFGCLMGFLTIIFALFMLRFIGVDILRIPGLG